MTIWVQLVGLAEAICAPHCSRYAIPGTHGAATCTCGTKGTFAKCRIFFPGVAWELKETWGFPKHLDLLGACRAAYTPYTKWIVSIWCRHHTGMSALREVWSGPPCTLGWQSHPRPALRVSHASEVTAQRTVGTNQQPTRARGLGELPGGRGALYPPQPHQG